MVFKELFSKLKPDPNKELSKFSQSEQERILNTIGTKESDLLRRKADLLIEKRAAKIEKKLGLRDKESKGKGVGGKFQSIKDFRTKNLERRAKNLEVQAKREQLFRSGQLAVKPVGQATTPKPIIPKQVNLKAPPSGMK